MTGSQIEQSGAVTTDGDVALINLHAQIEGLVAGINRLLADTRSSEDPLFIGRVVALIDLLELRGHISGRVADYERACELCEMLVQVTPRNGMVLLARARTRATLHRFVDALSDLDIAAHMGVSKSKLTSERVGILLVLGRYEEAESLLRDTGRLQENATMTGLLAVMHAERGQPVEADNLFKEARRSYRGTSPFAIAQTDFQRGVMWHREGALDTAQSCYEDALHLIPQYTPALGHLAEVEIHLGKPQAAAARLRSLTDTSDDPEYAATLATALRSCDKHSEADTWRERAATRYDELVMRHPEAYAHHAADFWLTEGADPERGLQLALQNLEFSQTPRAHALYKRAASDCARQAVTASK